MKMKKNVMNTLRWLLQIGHCFFNYSPYDQDVSVVTTMLSVRYHFSTSPHPQLIFRLLSYSRSVALTFLLCFSVFPLDSLLERETVRKFWCGWIVNAMYASSLCWCSFIIDGFIIQVTWLFLHWILSIRIINRVHLDLVSWLTSNAKWSFRPLVLFFLV